ncbi:MAG: Mur ligase family protein, partial [Dehalococcoidia bacterium]
MVLPLQRRAALIAGRVAGEATRRLGRGGGTALPGLVAATLAPGLVEALGRLPGHGSVTVTGTNGKTTTTHLTAAIARAAGLSPLTNHSGSNLERGLITAYVDAAGSRYRQESFAARIPETGSLVSFVRATFEAPRSAARVRFTPSARAPLVTRAGGGRDGASVVYAVPRGGSRTVYAAWVNY